MASRPLRSLLGLTVLLGVFAVAPRAEADDLDSARRRANEAAADLADAESVLGELDADIQSLEAQAASAQVRVDSLRDAVRSVAIQRFVNDDATRFTYADPDINNQARAEALSTFATQGNQDAIDEFAAAAEDLDVAKTALAERKSAQESAIERLQERQAALERELARLQELERERQAAEQRRRAAAARAAATTSSDRPVSTTVPAPSVSAPVGGIICPVQGPVAFTDTWGDPRSGGRAHKGVDMLSPMGTPTVAPVSGTVSHSGNGTGGLSWHLNGDNGDYYYGTTCPATRASVRGTSRQAPSSGTWATRATPAARLTSTSRSTPAAAAP